MADHAWCQVAFERTTRLPVDQVVNVFHFQCATTVEAAAPTLGTELAVFYTGVQATGFPVAKFMSHALTGVAHVKIYRKSGQFLGPPVYQSTFDIAGFMGTGRDLPAEVALCLSYRKVPVTGETERRQRGRIYVGPLTIDALNTGSTAGDMRPNPETMATIRQAGGGLMDNVIGADWCVYSPTSGQLKIIDEVSTDDAFDTQRRRGADPTTRVRQPANDV